MKMNSREDRLDVLLAKQDIYELMCRYCRGVDRFDKELVLDCFWPGAIDVHVAEGDRLHQGTAQDYFDQNWEAFKKYDGWQHYLSNMLIEVDGDHAVAETYQLSFDWAVPEPGGELDPELNWLNMNRYHDFFERRNGEWRILRRDFIRQFRTPIQPRGFPTEENGWIQSTHDHHDLAYRTVADLRDSIS